MYVDNTKEHIRHLSLCSGYEGIGLGLRRVLPNVREVAHVEIEGFAAANLVAKMEASQMDAAPVFTNLKEFPFRKFRGRVDILTGGFPCQPFSNAGSRKATEDPRHLFPFILEGIRECKPAVVFLENVEGIISCKTGDGESVLQYVLRSLEEVGYRATAEVFSASEVGAPHQRKRVFIMGYSNSDESSALRGYLAEMLGLQTEAWEDECPPVSGGASTRAVGVSNSQPSGEATGTKQPAEGLAVSGAQGNMANTDSGRGGEDWRQPKLWPTGTEQSPRGAWLRSPEGAVAQGQEGVSQGWPSRPGADQYEWEAPRTFSGEAQSKLGGIPDGRGTTVDPATNRVDRLRLLGNGVVPQVAARAYLVLSERLLTY